MPPLIRLTSTLNRLLTQVEMRVRSTQPKYKCSEILNVWSRASTLLRTLPGNCEKFSTSQNEMLAPERVVGIEDSSWTQGVDLSKLSDDEKLIHKLHLEAVQHRHETYTDPLTGYLVVTRYGHLLRGSCCGHCCRHCPYQHVNVPLHQRKKRFNTAFYV